MQTLHTNEAPYPVAGGSSAASLVDCASEMEQRYAQGENVVPSTPAVVIARQMPSVMQAGRANTSEWTLRFEPQSAPFIEPLMGWIGTEDTLQQVRLSFPTKERAISFAQRHGWRYSVKEPTSSTLRPKTYVDNFRYREPRVNPPPIDAKKGACKKFLRSLLKTLHLLLPPRLAAFMGAE